ncbi:MAG: hypothetical protein H6Q67_909 [Firmicutes bacterium]|nr:hypothetical protein [Bacillota bacterium]
MIIARDKLATMLKNYLPNADNETIDRIASQVEGNADAAVLSILLHAINEEGNKIYLH